MVLTYNNHEIELYDSIQDTPIDRYEKHVTYSIIDSSAGSSIYDLRANIGKAIKLIDVDKGQAKQVLQNAEAGIDMLSSGANPELMSFAVLVKSVDGKRCDDISEAGLRKTIDKIKDRGWFFNAIFKALQLTKKNFRKN